MGAPDHMPDDIEKAAEEASMQRSREALIRELGLLEQRKAEILDKDYTAMSEQEKRFFDFLMNAAALDDSQKIPKADRNVILATYHPHINETAVPLLLACITEQDITTALNKRNRRQMKIQFGLVDKKLADIGLSRDTATVKQLEDAIDAVTDDELNEVLAKERARTAAIMTEERRRGHVSKPGLSPHERGVLKRHYDDPPGPLDHESRG